MQSLVWTDGLVGRHEYTLKLKNRSWFRGITRVIGVANKGAGCNDQCPVTLQLKHLGAKACPEEQVPGESIC